MSVKIKYKEDGLYTVNGKFVYLDGNGNWIASEELTAHETRKFAKHRLKNKIH